MRIRSLGGVVVAAALVVSTSMTWARAEEDLSKKVDSLASQVQQLKTQLDQKGSASETASSHLSWLSVSGDLRVRHDILLGHNVSYVPMNPMTGAMGTPIPAGTIQNNSLLTNRFGLNLGARIAEGVTMKARLLMYKAFGANDSTAVTGNGSSFTFADRTSVFDGTIGHVPQSANLIVDYAYADVSNIMDLPVWFSGGRRPSTGGNPTNFRRNEDPSGISGVMGLLTDYAFDGFSLGVAPDYAKLPGLATKLCYGRAYQAGFQNSAAASTLENTDMLGVVAVPYETDNTYSAFQFQNGFHIMNTLPGPNVNANLGNLQDYGVGGSHAFRNIGIGDINVFGYGAVSRALPNSTTSGGAGLLYNAGQTPQNRTGQAVYVGARYDITKTKTKLGLEYNTGSKYWQNFTPAADDIWTSKLGTRGDVYEAYVIQELFRAPISSMGKVFFRLGYQYYKFDYTGSNNWVGDAMKISEITAGTPQVLTPINNAYDIYATFDVKF